MKRILLIALVLAGASEVNAIIPGNTCDRTHYCVCNNGSLESADCDLACGKTISTSGAQSNWSKEAKITKDGVLCKCTTGGDKLLKCETLDRCSSTIGSGWSGYVYSKDEKQILKGKK